MITKKTIKKTARTVKAILPKHIATQLRIYEKKRFLNAKIEVYQFIPKLALWFTEIENNFIKIFVNINSKTELKNNTRAKGKPFENIVCNLTLFSLLV